jgi:hypothetical protein
MALPDLAQLRVELAQGACVTFVQLAQQAGQNRIIALNLGPAMLGLPGCGLALAGFHGLNDRHRPIHMFFLALAPFDKIRKTLAYNTA